MHAAPAARFYPRWLNGLNMHRTTVYSLDLLKLSSRGAVWCPVRRLHRSARHPWIRTLPHFWKVWPPLRNRLPRRRVRDVMRSWPEELPRGRKGVRHPPPGTSLHGNSSEDASVWACMVAGTCGRRVVGRGAVSRKRSSGALASDPRGGEEHRRVADQLLAPAPMPRTAVTSQSI